MEPCTPLHSQPPPGWFKITYAKDQPQYRPLTVLRSGCSDGAVVSCWRLTWRERLAVLCGGRVWFTNLTFEHGVSQWRPLLPQLVHVNYPEYILRDAEPLV